MRTQRLRKVLAAGILAGVMVGFVPTSASAHHECDKKKESHSPGNARDHCRVQEG